MSGMFQVDEILPKEQELLKKYEQFLTCEYIDSTHDYLMTILSGSRNRGEMCRLQPQNTDTRLFGPIGPLRTCHILENRTHIHQYGIQGGFYSLRIIETTNLQEEEQPEK